MEDSWEVIGYDSGQGPDSDDWEDLDAIQYIDYLLIRDRLRELMKCKTIIFACTGSAPKF